MSKRYLTHAHYAAILLMVASVVVSGVNSCGQPSVSKADEKQLEMTGQGWEFFKNCMAHPSCHGTCYNDDVIPMENYCRTAVRRMGLVKYVQ